MLLLMDDHLAKFLVRIIYDVLVKVEIFIFLVTFVIIDCQVDFEVPIILGWTGVGRYEKEWY